MKKFPDEFFFIAHQNKIIQKRQNPSNIEFGKGLVLLGLINLDKK